MNFPLKAMTEANEEERVSVTVRLPKAIDRFMEIEAVHRDISKQQLYEEALRAYLNLTDAA